MVLGENCFFIKIAWTVTFFIILFMFSESDSLPSRVVHDGHCVVCNGRPCELLDVTCVARQHSSVRKSSEFLTVAVYT